MDINNNQSGISKYHLIIVACIFCSLITNYAFSQEVTFPEIGKQIPAFKFKNSTLSPVEEFMNGSKNLRGRYYILDFWSVGCAACIESFPKLNRLQRVFGERVKIILVGLESKYHDIEKAYAKYQRKMNLNLSTVSDSALFYRFVPSSIPYLIWVNPSGEIKAITPSSDLNEANIERFLSNQQFQFRDFSFKALNGEDKLPIDDTLHSMKGVPVFQSELLLLTNPSMLDTLNNIDHYLKRKQFGYRARSSGALPMLKLAFLGASTFSRSQAEVWPWPIVITDTGVSSKFKENEYYDYFLQVNGALAYKRKLIEIMQSDLVSGLNIKAEVVFRQFSYYEIVILDSIKVKSYMFYDKSKRPSWRVESDTNTIATTSLSYLPSILMDKLQDRHFVMINGTNSNSPISFQLVADITDLKSIKFGLKKVGLDIILKKKKFKALIIYVL